MLNCELLSDSSWRWCGSVCLALALLGRVKRISNQIGLDSNVRLDGAMCVYGFHLLIDSARRFLSTVSWDHVAEYVASFDY